FGLSVADKHDSQDICFVPSGRYSEVIERLKPGAAEPGDIVDSAGRVLGSHPGIIHFTVGQRRGLGVAAGHPRYAVRNEAANGRARALGAGVHLSAVPPETFSARETRMPSGATL